MIFRCRATAAVVLLLGSVFAGEASASESAPYHVRAGALMRSADDEMRLVYFLLMQKVFDVELARTSLESIEQLVANAKKSSFRAKALLAPGEGKFESEFEKLERALKEAEDSIAQFKATFANETRNLKSQEDDSSAPIGRGDDEDKETKLPDWDALKRDLGRCYKSLEHAAGLHARMTKALKIAPLRAPPPPKGK